MTSRGARPLVCALALLGALAVPAAPASADIRAAVHVCPTTYGVPGASFKAPPRTALLDVGAAAATRIVAWAGAGTPIVLGPAGYDCHALVAADGGVHVRLAPPGAATSGPAVDVEVEGSCVGCIVQLACGVFRDAANGSGFTCKTPRPAAERVSRLIANVRAFHDPAGVKGSGDPSGGRFAALGAILYVPDRSSFAARVTCTLAARDAGICQDVIADFLGRVR
jgi:hypothetical protein